MGEQLKGEATYSLGYLECIMDGATYCVHKNYKDSERIKFTLDPAIQFSGMDEYQTNKVSGFLAFNKIDHSKKSYKHETGTYFKIVITSIYNIKALIDLFSNLSNVDKIDTFKQFINLRHEKLLENKKARYDIREIRLYNRLRVLNNRLTSVSIERVNN